jgi:hypothetical protein
MFFFEKKNQKTFVLWPTGPGSQLRRNAKVGSALLYQPTPE